MSTRPLPATLLPDSAELAPDGGLMIGGCSLVDLAAEYGTPIFVYDEDQLRARCAEAVGAFGAGNATYASKAFLCKAMARIAYEEGMHLDVATGGELHTVLAADVPPDAIVMHGNNKSIKELTEAISVGVHRIVVDSFDELDRLDALHADGIHLPDGSPPAVLLRITPGVSAHTHEFISTGQDDSKFGFNLANGDAERAVERARSASSVELVGLHCHIGSNVFESASFGKTVETMAAFANPLGLRELVIGGGLGVPYVEGEEAPTITQWGNVVRDAAEAVGVHASIGVEPGRSIVAAAAVTVYTLGTIKDIPGVRTYFSVDGGMSDNPRPVLYGSGYEATLVREPFAERNRHGRLVGKHCESGDVLLFDAYLPDDAKVGDLVVVPVTGAYGRSMGSNYNAITRPPVVFASNGDAHLVVRRETYDDLLSTDVG